MKYRSEVDGLRALAVLPVILFHAGFPLFDGGFVGVDIFFVISGYLITTIIIHEIEEDKFSLSSFYERRARRILPALFSVLLFSTLSAYAVMTRSDFGSFSESLTATSLFYSNIFFWLDSDYFSSAAELKPLLHTWSLAIEEQYYIFFPLFLILFWRKFYLTSIGIIVFVLIVSLAISHYSAEKMPSANFYLLPTRAWELMFGSVVALIIKKKGVVKNNYLASLGVVLIFCAIFSFDSSTPFPSLYALLPVLGSALIILYANKETLVARILSLKPVVFIGLISYSAYLWHQPLFAIKRRTELFEPSLLTMTVLGGLSLVLAAFSWKYIEAPFRNREKVSSRGIFIFSTVGLVAFSLVGGVGASQSNNLSNIGFLNPLNETINIGSYEEDNKKLQRNSWSILKSISGNPDYSVENNSFDMRPWFDDDFEGRKVLVIGNSHSKDFFNVLYSNLKQGEDFQVARFGVQIRNLESGHRLFDSPNFLSSDTIVIATRYREADVENLKWLIKFLQQAEKKVIVTNNIFEFKEYRHGVWTLADYLIFSYRKNLPSANELAQRINTEYFSEVSLNNTNVRVRTLNQQIEHIVEGFESIKHYDRTSYVCDVEVGSCAAVDAKLNKYFYDYGHHTLTGAKYFGSQLDVKNILEF